MDEKDKGNEQAATATEREAKPQHRPGTTWSERLQFPLKFRHYTGFDAGGRERIFIKFELPPGETKLDPEALALVRSFKQVKHQPGLPTGLTFTRDKVHGKVYTLPNNMVGRAVADTIATKLINMGRQRDEDESRGR